MKNTMAIVGGGPSALFLLRRLVAQQVTHFDITIFERHHQFGPGFPYSPTGAAPEHVTNVSGNEIPDLATPLTEWLRGVPSERFESHQYGGKTVSEYRVVPRLLFGEYLAAQFNIYLDLAKATEIRVTLRPNTTVTSIAIDNSQQFRVAWEDQEQMFDTVVICCGHKWPDYDGGHLQLISSPYPPSKLAGLKNQSISLKGCSLTAVDAIRTLARANGHFNRNPDGRLEYASFEGCERFRIDMFSRHAILPGLRFHLEDPRLSRKHLITREAIQQHRRDNGGFVSLDYIFEENFKNQFKIPDPPFFARISNWNLETFVGAALSSFHGDDPFSVFESEFELAQKSIRRHQSEFWKEKLAILSAAMNYPAKYFSAEDHQRLTEQLMPLISVVIAFIPQNSAEEMIALRRANRLTLETEQARSLRSIEEKGCVIDCTGQPRLSIDQFPFPELVRSGAVSQARIKFKDKQHEMDVPGLAITDGFRAIDDSGKSDQSLYIMAVPYIAGFNPDYSGLDFCDDAASAIVEDMLNQ